MSTIRRRPNKGTRVLTIFLALLLTGLCAPGTQAQTVARESVLWFRKPAPVWTHALPVGNGRVGAMVFGGAMDRPGDFAVTTHDSRDLILTEGPDHKDEIRFRGQVRVLTKSGSVSPRDKAIAVERADEATLLIAAATDFKGGPIPGGVPALVCGQVLDAAVLKDYVTLRNAAIAEQRGWMNRVSFQIGADDPSLEALPTDERIRRVAGGADDLGLQALYFQFARY